VKQAKTTDGQTTFVMRARYLAVSRLFLTHC